MDDQIRPLYWVGSSRKDLKALPAVVQDVVGYALHLAQYGGKHYLAKPLKGYGNTLLFEVVEDYAGNTYRAMYVLFPHHSIYVLHCFKKKSSHGISMPRRDRDVINKRLQQALQDITENNHEKP